MYRAQNLSYHDQTTSDREDDALYLLQNIFVLKVTVVYLLPVPGDTGWWLYSSVMLSPMLHLGDTRGNNPPTGMTKLLGAIHRVPSGYYSRIVTEMTAQYRARPPLEASVEQAGSHSDVPSRSS